MKKIWIVSFLVGIVAFTFSCDNEVDLTAEFKDIPVVYGLLSRSDSMVQYIKVERAFLGNEGDNALEIAQRADSLYYENLDVEVVHENSGTVYQLERINGADEGIVREDGIFASQPNYLYKLTLPQGEELIGGDQYTLNMNRGDDKPVITAQTTVIGDFDLTLPLLGSELNFRYRPFSLTWKKADGAGFYDIKMAFRYLEQRTDGSASVETLIWPIEDNVSKEDDGSTAFNFEFDGEEFYRFLGAELSDVSGVDKRTFVSLDFIVDAGGEDLFDYINIGQANTGITSSQVIPTYSNISEGFGVFSSRNRVVYENFVLKGQSIDSLANGIYTNELRFDF